jgi:hypothetical protein
MSGVALAETSVPLAELSARVRDAIRTAMAELQLFVKQPAFSQALREMRQLPEQLRHEFVALVFLDADELKRRGVVVPPDIAVQRSEFTDKRPTLFCVCKHLPPTLVWKKVTITFDNSNPNTFIPVDHNLLEAV